MTDFVVPNDSRNGDITAQTIHVNRLYAQNLVATNLQFNFINVPFSEIPSVLPPDDFEIGTAIYNLYDARLYVLTDINSFQKPSVPPIIKRWVPTDALTQYYALLGRYQSAKIRRAVGVRGITRSKRNTDDIYSTTWTQGNVRYLITSSGSTVNAECFWFRSFSGIEYPHELALIDGEIFGGAVPILDVFPNFPPVIAAGQAPIDVQVDASGIITDWFGSTYEGFQAWTTGAGTLFVPDFATSPSWYFASQLSSESDSLFLQRMFGISAQNFSYQVNFQGNVDAAFVGVADANNYYPKSLVDGSNPYMVGTVPGPNGFQMTVGRLFFGPEVVFTSVDPQLYTIWREPDQSAITDRVLVALPSSVLNQSNFVNIEAFNNSPHAAIPLTQAPNVLRDYIRPTTTNGLPYLNFCQIVNQAGLNSLYNISASPGAAVWYFWNPGTSLMVMGPHNGFSGNSYFENAGRDPLNTTTRGIGLFLTQVPKTYAEANLMTTATLSTYVVGDVVLRDFSGFGDVPDTVDQFTQNVVVAFSGPSLPANNEDRIQFVSILGSVSFQSETPYKAIVNVSINDPGGDSGRFPDPVENPTVFPLFSVASFPSVNFTKNSADTSTFEVSALGVPPARVFDYGEFQFNTINASGAINSLFPPIWYVSLAQGLSPDVLVLQQRLTDLENGFNIITVPALASIIDSIREIGFVNELISNRILRLQEGVKLRLDELAEAIELIATSLNNYIESQSANFQDQIFTGGDDLSTVLDFIITNGPSIISSVGSIEALGVSFIGQGLQAGIDIANSQYRTVLISGGVTRLITQSMILLQNGDVPGGIALGVPGLLLAGQLFAATTFDGMNVTVNPSLIAIGVDVEQYLTPNEIAFIQPLDPESSQRRLLVGTTENVDELTQITSNLLTEVNELGFVLGFPPISDDDPLLF